MKTTKGLYSSFRGTIRVLVPWLCFGGLFAWGYRVRNFFTDVPAYGDVLEVLWGVKWYREALFSGHSSLLFTPLLDHPVGRHTTTLAFTPALFLFATPFDWIGGLAFAYNALVLLALAISFAGMLRFARLYISSGSSIVVALVFAFWRWGRVAGHLNVLLAWGLLPWLAWAVEHARRAGPLRRSRWVIVAGIIWSGIIDFSLYGVFWGAAIFVIWGRQLLKRRWFGYFALATGIAFLASFPVTASYAWGSQLDHLHSFGVEHNMWWGASLNSLPVPSVFHPLPALRMLSHALYTGPYNESGVMNFGLVTCALASGGAGLVLVKKRHYSGLIVLAVTGMVLALGLLLRWNGDVVRHPAFRPLDAVIWRIGHMLKPRMFPLPRPAPFEAGLPLPGLVLTAVVPFWDGARTVSRFAVVAMLGTTVLAGLALARLPGGAKAVLVAIWLVEALPNPTGSVPVLTQPHPAYAWLAEQDLNLGEGIADLSYPTLDRGGASLWATLSHWRPTTSGFGSFLPEHSFVLSKYLLADREALSRPDTPLIFEQYGVRYLFLHLRGDREKEMWAMIKGNVGFSPVACFDPVQRSTPWPYPICVAEVSAGNGVTNLLLRDGWSGVEPWGVWATGTTAWATWYAVQQEGYRLRFSAFANWLPGKRQSMRITLNGREVGTYHWTGSETVDGEIEMPPDAVVIGPNHLGFDFEYADLPRDPKSGAVVDSRLLSVGFTRLQLAFPFTR